MQLDPHPTGSTARGQTDHSALRRYVAKLERRSPLAAEDRAAFLALPAVDQSYFSGETIINQNVAATHCAFVADGMVSRILHLDEKSRQIIALHIAGDAIDLQSILLNKIGHAIYAHSRTKVSWISHASLLQLAEQRPALWRLLWLDTLVDASIFGMWTANMVRRNAQRRTAHLLLEMVTRLEAVGKADGDSFELPLKQNEMADVLGLSVVHMNRSLSALRIAGYIETRRRVITLRDRDKMVAFAAFDDAYLHLDGTRIKDLQQGF